MQHRSKLFIAAFLILCTLPLWSLFAASKNEDNAENRRLAAAPQLMTDQGLNIRFLPDAGAWFEDHFGLRERMVTGNALLRSRLFGVSSADGVIDGTDGWLYYTDSLSDYQGTKLLDERSLFAIAHSLSMLQEHLSLLGIRFAFGIAPNKNTLYPEHMPYYDSLIVSAQHNLDRLETYLETEQVNYVPLKDLLNEEMRSGQLLYHLRDSHWNNYGACLAADALLSAAGLPGSSFRQETYHTEKDFYGDLDRMLFPSAMTAEDEICYNTPFTYAYKQPIESTFDPMIETDNDSGRPGLVVFRDSFGNALLPFLAQEAGQAFFSRGVPWQISEVYARNPAAVIAVRAERFLKDMAQNPPFMQAPQVFTFDPASAVSVDIATQVSGLSITPSGYLTKITGILDPAIVSVTDRIYLRVGGNIYEAFPMLAQTPEGEESSAFCACLPAELLPGEDPVIEIFLG